MSKINQINQVVFESLQRVLEQESLAPLEVHYTAKPTPASRPRVSRRGHAFYSKSYKEWRTQAFEDIKDLLDTLPNIQTLDGPLAVMIRVAVPAPKKTAREYPRGDVDNFAKGPLDAITKAPDYEDGITKIWGDDDQVVMLFICKEYEEVVDKQGMIMYIYPINVEKVDD